jgi:hypothetical protein
MQCLIQLRFGREHRSGTPTFSRTTELVQEMDSDLVMALALARAGIDIILWAMADSYC